MARIEPTIGRVILFFPGVDDATKMTRHDDKPFKADVIYVWGPNLISVDVTDHVGQHYARSSIPIIQEGSPYSLDNSDGRSYAMWMDYQIGQAARYEKAQAELIDALKQSANPLA